MSPPLKMPKDVLIHREVVVRVMLQRPAPEHMRLRSLMWMIVDMVSTLLFIAAVFERRATFHYGRNVIFVYCAVKCISCIANGIITMLNIKRPQTNEVVFIDMEYMYIFRFAVHLIVSVVLFW